MLTAFNSFSCCPGFYFGIQICNKVSNCELFVPGEKEIQFEHPSSITIN